MVHSNVGAKLCCDLLFFLWTNLSRPLPFSPTPARLHRPSRPVSQSLSRPASLTRASRAAVTSRRHVTRGAARSASPGGVLAPTPPAAAPTDNRSRDARQPIDNSHKQGSLAIGPDGRVSVQTAAIAAGDVLKVLSSICKSFPKLLVMIKLEKIESKSEIS